jgi:hypothetical protein
LPLPGTVGAFGGPETFASGTNSGTIVATPPGDSIRWMQGDWVIPNVSAATPDRDRFCAFWIGIGGSGGAAYQAGVHVKVSGANRQMFLFWEWLVPGNGHIVDITNLAVRPGDLLSVILCTGQGAGSTDGTVYFFNRTTGAHTSVAVFGPALAASTAEWSVGFPFLWLGDASILAEDGEWWECRGEHGDRPPRPLNPTILAQLLRSAGLTRFNIRSRTIRWGHGQGDTYQGYKREWFTEAWRWLDGREGEEHGLTVVRGGRRG